MEAVISSWQTAVITATIKNWEKARKTTATNVKAELQLPSGFSIISGTNPQTTSLLHFNNYWTCQWTVHAPLFTFGTKTFDVIVWSDNLGVEVDDYDDPYHKVNVTFLGLVMVLADYLQLNIWWHWAKRQYTHMTEPAAIMKISKDLEVYKKIEDLEEDPNQFLELMIKMVELENAFGLKMLELEDVDKEPIQQYLEIVDDKIKYLTELQTEGLKNPQEVLTKLSTMQIRINQSAMKTFTRSNGD